MSKDKLTLLRDEILKLHESVRILNNLYPKKKFTLDGRLVGDIGEVIVEEVFDVTLYEKVKEHYDAFANYADLQVQIKATFKDQLTFNHDPQYYIGIKLHENGEFEVIYNGPGKYIYDEFRHRKNIGQKLLSFPIAKLKEISENIDEAERIRLRENKII